MKQTKKQKKHHKGIPEEIQSVSFLYNKPFYEKYNTVALIGVAVLAVLTGLFFLVRENSTLGLFSFPLDDSWIHLTFAKNLVEYGKFSYFKDQMVTSGSTAPIYTLLLAVLYIFIKNEFIISHILGIGFFAFAVFWGYKLLKSEYKGAPWFAILTILVLALQPRLNFIALAGMETTMYICLLIMAFYFYRVKMKWPLGITLGLLVWCRPDGLVLWIAFLIDYFISTKWSKSEEDGSKRNEFTKKELITFYGIAAAIVLVYFVFNLILSGYILPNTFRSKTAIYTNLSRALFIKNDIADFFSTDELMIIWIPFIISFFFILRDFFKRKYNNFTVFLLFIIGLPLLYYIELPSSSMYGRYLLPVLPLYIITAGYGVKCFIELLFKKSKTPAAGNFIFILFWATAVILSVTAIIKQSDLYNDECRYYHDRHMVAAKWIEKNTSPNAVIATHDVGAIAFYGNRRVLDMVGLVNPGIIKEMSGNFTDFLNRYLIEQKVDYIATLRSWFEIVNDIPVFTPVQQPEILDVFKFTPGKTYIQSGAASNYINNGIQLMNINDQRNAESYFQQAVQVDPRSAKANFILAYFYYSLKDRVKSEEYLNKALSIFPESPEANYLSALMQYDNKEYQKAKEILLRAGGVPTPQIDGLMKEIDSKLSTNQVK